jgi:hypothetical protein
MLLPNYDIFDELLAQKQYDIKYNDIMRNPHQSKNIILYKQSQSKKL